MYFDLSDLKMTSPKIGEYYSFKSGTFIRVISVRPSFCFFPSTVVFRYIYVATADNHLPMRLHRNSTASITLEQWQDMINDRDLTLVMAYRNRKNSVSN